MENQYSCYSGNLVTKYFGQETEDSWEDWLQTVLCEQCLNYNSTKYLPARCMVIGRENVTSDRGLGDYWCAVECKVHMIPYYKKRFFPQFLTTVVGGMQKNSTLSCLPHDIRQVIASFYWKLFSSSFNPMDEDVKNIRELFLGNKSTPTSIMFWGEKFIVILHDQSTLAAKNASGGCFVALSTKANILCGFAQVELKESASCLRGMTFSMGRQAYFLSEQEY